MATSAPSQPTDADATAHSPAFDQLDGRRRILDASAALFVDQGYVGTSLRQIATAVGIQPATIYHHFASKEELFVAVLVDGIDVMVDAFEATAQSATRSESARDRLFAHVRAHLGAVFEHGPYTTAHVTAFFTAPADIRERVVPQRDRYERRWQDLLADLAPHSSNGEMRIHRLLLFGAMNTTVEWYDPDGGIALDDLAATITDQFLTGIDASSDVPPGIQGST